MMKAHIRYYNFWNKKLTKREKKRNFVGLATDATQIKRSYNWGMITEEQYKEFQERIEILKKEELEQCIYALSKR